MVGHPPRQKAKNDARQQLWFYGWSVVRWTSWPVVRLTGEPVVRLTNCTVDRLYGWPVDGLTGWRIDRLYGWLIVGLTGCADVWNTSHVCSLPGVNVVFGLAYLALFPTFLCAVFCALPHRHHLTLTVNCARSSVFVQVKTPVRSPQDI